MLFLPKKVCDTKKVVFMEGGINYTSAFIVNNNKR